MNRPRPPGEPGGPGGHAAPVGDGLVSAHPDARLAILTADCAPVALASAEGVIGVAHAGWRGLMAGVIGATIEAMRALGAGRIVAGVGPCIHPECYEFSAADLAAAVGVLGESVRASTARGLPALDLRAGVHAALGAACVEVVAEVRRCTACSEDLFSHRARGESQRQALVVWRQA